MRVMFVLCSNFNQKLEFDTKNVKDMVNMFDECKSLEKLPKFYTDYLENKCE